MGTTTAIFMIIVAAAAFTAGLAYGKSIGESAGWNNGARAMIPFIPDDMKSEVSDLTQEG